MSTTGHKKNLLNKARALRNKIAIGEAYKDLLTGRICEKREQNALRAKISVMQTEISEENRLYAELRRDILTSGYNLSDEENEKLIKKHLERLEQIKEKHKGEEGQGGAEDNEEDKCSCAAAERLEQTEEKFAKKKQKLQAELAAVEKKIAELPEEKNGASLDKNLILSIKDLKMYFGGVKAVDGLSFDVRKGEIFGLIGPNGAGKTTVFNCITQFYKPTSGTLLFRGCNDSLIDLTQEKVHDVILHGIVRTFQNVEVVPELTVLQNLLIAAHRRYSSGVFASALHLPKLRREEEVVRAKAEKVLEFMGLSAFSEAYAFGLPYGILKKIEIARTLMCSPRLIILDEPAAGLNDTETGELAELICRIRDEFGCTILLVEHDMGLVMDVCDSICAISFGKMLAYGSPEQIQADRNVQQAYLGVDEEGG